jgi:hypothetical protein
MFTSHSHNRWAVLPTIGQLWDGRLYGSGSCDRDYVIGSSPSKLALFKMVTNPFRGVIDERI